MPAHCKIEDPLKLDIILLPFGLNDMGTPLFDCLRILCGTVNFRNKKTNRLIKPRKCFVSNRKRTIKKSTLDDLISVVFDGDLKQKDLKEALVKGSNDNKTFWEDLRAELCLCIVAREKGLNVDAFLYLYRIFELVSIALPLVYISSLSDYKKSMDFVKSLSNNTNDGELTVFKNFVSSSQLMRDYRYLVIDFDTNHEDEKWRIEIKSQLDKYVFSESKIKQTHTDGIFALQFTSVLSFIVSCRNRLFHNSHSGANFKLDPLNGADSLCKMLIDPALYFLSLVLVEVVKAHTKRYI